MKKNGVFEPFFNFFGRIMVGTLHYIHILSVHAVMHTCDMYHTVLLL